MTRRTRTTPWIPAALLGALLAAAPATTAAGEMFWDNATFMKQIGLGQ